MPHTLLLVLLGIPMCLSQTASPTPTPVTLWQFGQGRLVGGVITLPLEPLGTASGGLATTYLFKVQNPVTTIVTDLDGQFTTLVSASLASRTVVASASGWIEGFDGPKVTYSCALVNSAFGECALLSGGHATVVNSGLPTPEVFTVSTAPPHPSTSKPNVRIIVVVTVTSCLAVLFTTFITIWVLILRRRRAKPNAHILEANSRQGDAEQVLGYIPQIFTKERRDHSDASSGLRSVSHSSNPSVSEERAIPAVNLSTPDLARLLYERMQGQSPFSELPPPAYRTPVERRARNGLNLLVT
ncbi:hypothetical protein MIND_00623900 [Mycena indigotica]|uniref:Transmembrane protein n=1 Tax=Mycena indigotica TaxID=2126181 RepID=A0A8H6W6Z6_9AGAR|nr:uncharacterized protein MIND_00623900 [Mycena indigotica]KAF7303933.1 hypothetical protein MIND_00623900 [Mycena indigotica]